jgi:hypothetical protein
VNDKQTLTLEAGKYYRTRDGKKVFIVGQNPFDTPDHDVEFPFGGFVQRGEGDRLEWFRGDGVHGVRAGGNLDLVAEWVEPKRIKGWVNLFLCADGKQFHTNGVWKSAEEAAEKSAGRIACIEIDVLEGHGLDGEGA